MAQGWTPADVVSSFLSSDEFLELDKTNGEIIDILYRILANRSASPDEKSRWRRFLGEHSMKDLIKEVFHTFEAPVQSSAPVQSPAPTVATSLKLTDKDSFLTQCYRQILGREPDSSGLSSYRRNLDYDEWSAARVVNSFLYSDEFSRLNKSDRDIVVILYRVIMGLDPTSDEINRWLRYLDDHSRKELINELCSFGEVKKRFTQINVNAGSISLPSSSHKNDSSSDEEPPPQKYLCGPPGCLSYAYDDEEYYAWEERVKERRRLKAERKGKK